MNDYDDLFENQTDQLSKDEYAARKKAERDDLFTLSDNAAMEVSSDSGRLQQYLDVQSKFTRYSTVNALLILAQKPESTRIADFEHWKNLGGFVKPGQTAISILEPHEYMKENGLPGTSYNVKKVFDISQVDVRKIKTPPPQSYTERQLLAALISKAPMKISGADELPDDLGAMTNPETGEITVRKGMEFADTFRSLAQELGYYEADRDAFKIPANPYFIGYCTSYILCRKYGVDTKDFDFTNASGVFENLSPQGVKQELSIIRDSAYRIAERMTKHLEKAAKTQDAR